MSYYQQQAQRREQYEKMSAAIQNACPQGVATESTIEELMYTTGNNLSEAESLANQINERLFGSVPAKDTGAAIGAPCIRNAVANFAARTFDLTGLLRGILVRLAPSPAIEPTELARQSRCQ